MSNLIRFQLVCLLQCLCLLLGFTTVAQVQTPRYVSMNANTHAYYEYLPQGYATSSQTYPLMIFIHGTGEKGDGSPAQLSNLLKYGPPKLIQQGIFPASFTVNGKTFRYIIISPQFIDWPTPPQLDDVINYCIKKYRVNTKRIYITGLSMGGGVAWDYAGTNSTYASKLAAIVPVCGSSHPDLNKCKIIAEGNIAVWATHNNNDPQVPSSNTIGYVNGINSFSPKIPAKKTLFISTEHDAWTKTYDLNFKENNLNVYQWMLQFERGSTPPSTSTQQPPVVVNPSTPTTTTAPSPIGSKYVMVNIYGGSNPYSNVEWNNWNVGTTEATNISSGVFKYSNGTSSGISAVLSHSQSVGDNRETYSGGMAPAAILRYTSYSQQPRTLTIKGLSPSKKYTIELYASRYSIGNSTIFTVNGKSITIQVYDNFTNKAVFNGITPNAQGQVIVGINKGTNYNHLNGFMISE